MRRVMRTIVWGAAGAVPGLIMLAIPGFVESQAENLLLGAGGFLLAILGAVFGAVAGWQQERQARWRLAGGAIVGLLFGAVIVVLNERFGWFRSVVGLLVALVAAIAGAAIGRRSASSSTETTV